MAGRHTARTTRAALLVAGTLALTAAHPPAGAASPPAAAPLPSPAQAPGAGRPDAALLRALQRDLHLTPTQATTRLANEAEAGARAGLLRNSLGEHFAGAWLSGTTSALLTVATTRAADAAAIRAQGAEAAVVPASLADLRAVKQRLDAAVDGADGVNTPVRSIDVRTNRVVLQATTRAAAEALIARAGVAGKRISVQLSEHRPRALADIVGGDPYYIDDTYRCSVGFSVTKGEQKGFATAGHCGKPGSTTTGAGDVAQGTFKASTFPGKDMAWVGVTGGWTVTPKVRGADDATVEVAGSVQALVGASVCRSGSTSGWHCGKIEQENATVTYEEGTVNGLTRTTVCGEPGDSGGSYVAGAQAQGVLSGGSGDCTTGGTTFFQPINALLSGFGLTLVTTAAQATPSAPSAPDETPAADAWTSGRVYEAGATVTYGAVRYQCLQPHQAQAGARPESTPALWQRV
ncbi:alpha-lytic protease prodomain-containing protein [Streptomyces sp. NPDC053367]|uniref:alpha-lytic protease prodomain-containing protein n=1 Tax=Streptomyces sp. NPDC053367 TaxID=3365700 RepID=UPI0037D13FD4